MGFLQALKVAGSSLLFQASLKALCYFKTPLKAQIFRLKFLEFCFCFHLEFLKFNPPRRYFIVFIASPGTCFKILILCQRHIAEACAYSLELLQILIPLVYCFTLNSTKSKFIKSMPYPISRYQKLPPFYSSAFLAASFLENSAG